MASIPQKLQCGDNFKSATVKAINLIIDYLRSQRIVGDNKTVVINQTATGITVSAKPQIATPKGSKGGLTTVYVSEGAAIPAMITSQPNSWGLPYSISLYPNGYGGLSSTGEYALPTAVAFADVPPTDARIIVFKSYVEAVGGDTEAEGDTN